MVERTDAHRASSTNRLDPSDASPGVRHTPGDRRTGHAESTGPARSRVRRLHRFFEATCDATPDAVALECDGERLTYRELDERANRLAHHLIHQGIVAGDRVGILLHRSTVMYVALLAALKAEATFVPIDPSAPPDRVAYMAKDSELKVVLSSSHQGALAAEAPCPVLELDALGPAPADLPASRPTPGGDVDPVCYVIYTSGSTGRPKGVEVAQSSICNFIDVVSEVYGVRRTDRVYQGMTIAFDFSIEEIWPTWAVGATLVAGPTDARRIGTGLAEFLTDARITVLYCVPTVLATVDRELPLVRTLLVGGEACPAELVERWARLGRRMLNTYGPTEATVTATWAELRPGRPVTIGRPLPTYAVTLLDESLQPVPDGAVGEICIGGAGVARGYLGRPDLTADRFLEDPRITGGGRLYRTGDLGRRLPDGEIEYLGRADSEVKVRGHRVDLQEIESVILEDLLVTGAVVTPYHGGDDLVAYVMHGETGDDLELVSRTHQRLSARLPAYMVPAFMEVVDSLPMLPSGKVDRKSLPVPSGRRLIASGGPVVNAVTPTEHLIAGVWAEVFGLDVEDVSVEADFFLDLGGHSLLAARTASSLRRETASAHVSVADVYQHPSIRRLAGHLDATARAASDTAQDRPGLIRHRTARVAGAGLVQSALIYSLLLVFGLPAAAVFGLNHGALDLSTFWGLIVTIPISLVAGRFVLPVVGIRLLARRLRPGTYPLWGLTFLRLWAVQALVGISPLGTLSGSPLLAPYLRLLGARVGRRCHILTGGLPIPTLLDIGDDACVGYGAQLQSSLVENGRVVIDRVSVGARTFVGAGAVVQPGARIGDDAALAELSLATRGQSIPAGEYWTGSPSARSDAPDPLLREMGDRRVDDWSRPARAAFAVVCVLLDLLPLVSLTPAVALTVWALGTGGRTVGLLGAFLTGPLYVVATCLIVAVGKRLVLPATPTGIHPIASTLGFRKWVSDRLFQISLATTNALYATLYTPPWLRALGARIGRRSEVSTASHLDPDLLTLEDESFIADMAGVGGATYHHGQVALGRTVVGRRSFVGNAALLRSGATIGDGSLVGVQTMAPHDGVPGGTSWLGSPALRLPRRQDSGHFGDELTFQPSRLRVIERLVIEFFRITAPGTLLGTAAYLVVLGDAALARTLGMAGVTLLAPAMTLMGGLGVVLAVAALKWLIVGCYRPRVEPLWSRFVRRTEFVTALYETAAVPALLGALVGTPMLGWALRLFGVGVGRRAWIATTYLTEFDLVRIRDDVAVGQATSLQTHLFEDRVMKMSHVVLESGASVGARSVVLYDGVVGEGVTVDALSLVMKGERLPERTRWSGIPSRPA
ncbi:Pls/PosA family non-ribosomal peptide synthetase [Actinoallomurus sp. NPDC052274]|uniref:Pls/PosA family non-ribosomal peptide synthetase n=1 Tax=Actinoallomurus sp. NPDC052274 TaxID=3155420 RepID=UPI003426AED5